MEVGRWSSCVHLVIYKKFTHRDKKDEGDGMQGAFLEASTQSEGNGRVRYALLPMENVLQLDEILFIPFIPVNIFLISFLSCHHSKPSLFFLPPVQQG